jgi:DNA-binding LacI/PurR family transcriptional regulator
MHRSRFAVVVPLEIDRGELVREPLEGAVTLAAQRVYGALPGARRRRSVAAERVSAISFDVHQIAYWIRPRLTTVALPHHKLGRPGVEGLFETMRRAAGETDAQGPVYPSRCCCARGSG